VTGQVTRSGPFGAWWVRVSPRRHGPTGISLELPAGRARAWNVAAVLFAAGDLYVAHRVGVLGWLLAAIAVMVAAGALNIARITRRHSVCHCGQGRPSEEAAERARVAAWIAARHATPATERGGVAA
jgi:hypothetical protein